VFGVGSELVTYLPDSIDPPFLDTMPNGIATGATPPAQLVPADAVSIISCILIVGFLNCYVAFLIHTSRTVLDSIVVDFHFSSFSVNQLIVYAILSGLG